MKISATILTKNSEKTLEKTLRSLCDLAEVIVLDTGSTDHTIKLASSFSNVKVHRAPFSGFGMLRNQAAQLASYDWILGIDSDEVMTDKLREEILQTKLNPDHLYAIPFHNYYNGKWIRFCGWHPESHIRLYHRKKYAFNDLYLHEGIEKGNSFVHYFHHPIHHYSYQCLDDFLVKTKRYGDLFVEQNQGKIKPSFRKAVFHGIFAFCKSYFLKKGFLGGKEGLIISWYQGNSTFYKYIRLLENEEKTKCS